MSHDKDSITMAVAAASDCLSGFGGKKIDGLRLATTDQNRLVKVEKS
jgi:3-hydroxy-3-methylglutaryl CoA synthase